MLVLSGGLWLRFGASGLDIADKLGSVISAIVSVALVVSAVVARAFHGQRMAQSERSGARGLQLARDDLVQAVRRQWLEEARIRSLRRPAPLRVTWAIAQQATAIPSKVESGGIHSVADQDRDASPAVYGDLEELSATFGRLPYRQMIVLGGPGAGKTATAILLTLDLIEQASVPDRHGREKPVPVLVSPAGWNPATQGFQEWLVTYLLQTYPWLDSGDDSRVILRLLQGRQLLPILDGLDEMPSRLHTLALDAIDSSVPTDQPLILTSRTSEYESAVEDSGAPLAGYSVIKLEPPSIGDIGKFLTAGRFGQLWQPVLDEIRRRPTGPLALALSTPLMVTLARSQYNHRFADSAELLSLSTAEEVRDHLLDEYIPSVYSAQAQAVTAAEDAVPRLRYDPVLAGAWLTFLAEYLVERDTEDIDWWALGSLLPTGVLVTVAGVFGGVAIGVVTGAVDGPAVALVCGVLVALAFGLMAYLVAPMSHQPRRVVVRLRGELGTFVHSLLTAAPYALAFAAAFGAVAALVAGLAAAGVTAFVTMVGMTIMLGLLRWFDASEEARAEDPISVLRSDRAAGLANALTFGAVASIASAIPASSSLGPGLGVAAGLCVGMLGLAPVVALFTAWGRFTLARLWFASRGQLPLRLITFLADAHRRGVLRQAGPSYRFRHTLLRDRLASHPAGSRPVRNPALHRGGS